MAKIKIRRGTAAQLSGITLDLGELGYTTDTKKIYIGNGVSNTLVGSDVDDTPTNGSTTTPISSNWAYDHQLSSNPHNSATDLTFKLGDAAGTYKFSITDSGDVEQFSVDSNGVIYGPTGAGSDIKFKLAGNTNGEKLSILSADGTEMFYVAGDSTNGSDIGIGYNGNGTEGLIYLYSDTWLDGFDFNLDGGDIILWGGKIVAGSGNDLTVKLGDAAGAKKLSVTDSADVEQFYVDSDGNVAPSGNLYMSGTKGIIESPGTAGTSSISLVDGNVFHYLGDAAGSTYFGVADSGISDVFTVDSDGNVIVKGNLSLFTGNGDILMDINNQIILQNSTDRLAIKLGDDAGFSTFEILNSSTATVFWVDATGAASFDGDVDFQGAATGNGTVPTGGTSGQILTKDSATNYDLIWADASGGSVTVSDTAPGTPSAGDLWFDSSAGILSMYYDDGSSTQWVSISSGSWGTIQIDWGDIGGTLSAQTDLDTALGLKLAIADIDDTPVNGETDAPISSNWAYDLLAGTNTFSLVNSTGGVKGSYLHADRVGFTAPAAIYIDVDAGQDGSYRLRTGSTDRWRIGKSSVAESGSDAGSDFYIAGYDDAGAWIATPLSIERSTGNVNISEKLSVGDFACYGGGISLDKVGDTSDARFVITGDAGYWRYISLQTNYTNRWAIGADDVSEAGSNAGSNFQIINYNDAGTSIGTCFEIERSTGDITIENDLAVTGAITQNSNGVLDTSDVDDTPVDSATTAPISSNWAYDHVNDPDAHGMEEYIAIACSDETTDLAVATGVATFRAPYAMTITKVRASVITAPTDANIIVDINDSGTSIMTTNKLSIDATEKTSVTAATAPGLTDTSIADDAEITIDIDQIGSTIAGAGLKVVIYYTRT